jgi:hypothetical protein
VSYFRPWFLWPETKKLVIRFYASILLLASYPCIVYPHIGDLTNLAGYHWVWIINSRKIDGAKIENFKYLSQGKVFPVPTFTFITSLPDDEQTYKHGGGGRYNAILKFKGEQIKKFWWERKKEKEKEWKRNKEEKLYVRGKKRKEKNMSMCKK